MCDETSAHQEQLMQDVIDGLTEDLQRSRAELINYKRRTELARSQDRHSATIALVAKMLPLLDDIARASDHGDLENPNGMLLRRLLHILAQEGLDTYGTKGDVFDPTIHEAVVTIEDPTAQEPVCADIIKPGYTLGDTTLRVAHVVVGIPTETSEPAASEGETEDTPEDPSVPVT